jgi:hypothetical protein
MNISKAPDVVVGSQEQKCGLKYVIETSSKLVRTSPINDGDSLSQKVSISVLVIKKNECKISLIFKNNKYCIFWIKFMFNIILYDNKRLL